jgi:16S rRNA (guanine(1405)-N(7))-methyltransferase
MSELERVIAAVVSSKKYRTVCADTIRRVAEQELMKHDSVKEAAKATKRRLHQVYGAFQGGALETDADYQAAYGHLAAAYESGDGGAIRVACREIMAGHSSTRERLPVLDRFYDALWQVVGRPSSVLDMGCGLNPLALPWMDLPAGGSYIALDIDGARIAFLDRYLALTGLPYEARCQDVLVRPPGDVVDLALLLKMSPSLERQEAGATLRLVEKLQALAVAVSYAVKSLGGREKGMVGYYSRQFETWAGERGWPVESLEFESELVFVVRTGGRDGLPAR